ncbi:glycosyltransferase [Nitrosomonas sp.]|uniref:glycosyltransferase family 2 protein n=1 Tax=Nitrosomonas sp. TaxID=42353 RepID=UPI0025DCF896|nr:glycosyltransferase [Nitrosomonas sp.]MCC6915680.1 glycosyltransferase [Nitrosomonas sp.]
MITISVVSHGQSVLVKQLLKDLVRLGTFLITEVLITLNIPEDVVFKPGDYPFPVRVLRNTVTRGFGANHNAAFRQAKGKWFCVLNPDIRLTEDPFPVLLGEITRLSAAVIAPMVITSGGEVEDSIRRFPTPFSLVVKFFGQSDGRYIFAAEDMTFRADWAGGMFMLFRAEDFRAVAGFDEKYFLYYEDVDICARLWKSGRSVLACPKTRVIHDAQRTSRRSLRYMRWHIASMLRYFWKHWGRLPGMQANSVR